MRWAFVFLLLGACATAGPKQAVLDYLHAEQQGGASLASAWKQLTPEDQTARPLPGFIADHTSAGPVWAVMAAHTTFSVSQVQVQGAQAIVHVLAHHPDANVLVELTAGIPNTRLATSEDPDGLLRQALEQTLQAREIPTAVDHRAMHTRLLNGQWHVWLGLTEQNTALALARQAQAAEQAGDLDTARTQWAAVIDMPRDPGGFVEALADEAVKALSRLANP